jgi:hypothetical protein
MGAAAAKFNLSLLLEVTSLNNQSIGFKVAKHYTV